jgi:hypothetical protein
MRVNKEGSIATALDGAAPLLIIGNALVSSVKSELHTIGSALRFERPMKSERAGDSRDSTENHQTTDLAILQSLALTRIIHEASTAAADPGMSAALRSVGLLGVLSSTPAGPSVARLASMPVCAASLRTFMNNAG